MKITIITPSFNQVDFIEDTITSIWSQKGGFELEHIIADGGSTDGSVEVIKKYDALYKSRKVKIECRQLTFLWWSRKDKGQTDAINQAVAVATGEIINWINSDDILVSKNSLAIVAEAFKKHSPDIVIGRGGIIDISGKNIGEGALLSRLKDNDDFQRVLPSVVKGNFLSQQSLFFKRSLLKATPLDASLHYTMDWDVYIKFLKKNDTFYFIPKIIGAIREHPEAKTQLMPKRAYQERLMVYRRNNVWSAGRVHAQLKIWVFDNAFFSRLIDLSSRLLAQMMSFYNNRREI